MRGVVPSSLSSWADSAYPCNLLPAAVQCNRIRHVIVLRLEAGELRLEAERKVLSGECVMVTRRRRDGWSIGDGNENGVQPSLWDWAFGGPPFPTSELVGYYQSSRRDEPAFCQLIAHAAAGGVRLSLFRHPGFSVRDFAFILHLSSFSTHPSSFCLHPSAFILHNFPFRPREAIDAGAGNGLGSEMFRPRAAVPAARASWAARLEKGESSGKRRSLVC